MRAAIISLTILVVVVVAIGIYASAYVVEEGRQVVITEFGKPVATVEDPGLKFKTPFIQKVHVLEKRLLPWNGSPESMQTRDKKRIDVIVWARWKIVEPKTFFVKVRTEQGGQKILDDLVDSAIRDVIARHNLIDVVRKSNSELLYEIEELERTQAETVKGRGRDDVEEEILHSVDLQEYGMELIRVRIKRVNYVESVRRAVYDRMISERQRIARLYQSEAVEDKNRILGQTHKELDEITGEMEQKSAEIRGVADAKVIQMTAEAYGRSPDFFEFLRRLEVYKNTLRGKTRLILSTDSDLFRMLKDPETSRRKN